MSKAEEDFLQRLHATFKVEAGEHLQAISAGLLALEKTPAAEPKGEPLEAIFRHAHSLKGAARAVSSAGIEAVCQSLEGVFAAWKRRELDLAPGGFDTLHRALDLMGRLTLSVGSSASAGEREQLQTITSQLGQLLPVPSPGSLRPEHVVPAGSAEREPVVLAVPPAAVPLLTPQNEETSVRENSPAAPAPPALTETIRISAAKLDRLLLDVEELLAVKQATGQRAAELRQFEAIFEQWGKQWAKIQPQFRELRNAPGHSALVEFLDWNWSGMKTLEGKLRAVGKSAAQDRHVAGKRVDDLLADAKQLVMLPFATLSNLFPKLVRDLCRDQGKEADLVVRGGEVELDKRILEQMKDPLIHLLRNCVDHGVESPRLALRRNKPPRATITIAVAPVTGNKVEILVADDGAGVDMARVKESVVRRGLISAEEAQQMDESRVLELIFRSEVSTSAIITEISGRGLGLAIVREQAEKLGGRVTVESRPQAGTTFRLVLPLSLATCRGILVRAGDAVFVIPSVHIERVARVRPDELRTVENREVISLNDRAVSFTRLERVLELALPQREDTGAKFIPVVVLGSGDERIAFGVDEVLHDEEVLVKGLNRPLSRVRNIAGVTLLATGKVVPILNVSDLMKSARKGGAPAPAGRATSTTAPAKAKPKAILLAEDSITSRMLLKGILESAGYRVKTAVDGVEAFAVLRTEDFDLVVSDIEMPRMDGFDLTTRIRADKKLAELPVVLVTALSSPADREHGIDVGANAYIVKSSFDQSNLLEVIRRLTG